MGLWEGDGHRSPSLCIVLPESALLAETRTDWHSAMGGRTHLCPESSGNSGRTRAGTGMTLEKQRGPPPLCQTDPRSGIPSDGSTSIPRLELLSRQKIGRQVQYSRNVNRPQREELVLGPKEKMARKPVQGARPWTSLAVYVGHNRHIVRPDYDMIPPENGEKILQSQEDSPEFQAVYMPKEELFLLLSTRRPSFEDRAPACHWCVRRDHMATVDRTHSHPALEKDGVSPH